ADPADAASAPVDDGLGPVLGARSAVPGLGPAAGPDRRREVLVVFLVHEVPGLPGESRPGRGLPRRGLPRPWRRVPRRRGPRLCWPGLGAQHAGPPPVRCPVLAVAGLREILSLGGVPVG